MFLSFWNARVDRSNPPPTVALTAYHRQYNFTMSKEVSSLPDSEPSMFVSRTSVIIPDSHVIFDLIFNLISFNFMNGRPRVGGACPGGSFLEKV